MKPFVLIFPGGIRSRAGIGTCPIAGGCRGFSGPVPLPLLMSARRPRSADGHADASVSHRGPLPFGPVGLATVILASNRGPISFRREADGTISGSRGGGGLVSAMSALVADDTTLWVCAALSDIDRDVANQAPQGRIDLAGYPTSEPVRMLAIPAQVVSDAYSVISNTTLWYLHHEMVDPAHPFDFGPDWQRAWVSYRDYNEAFADAIVDDAAPQAKVLAQDYHLTLLPGMLRRRRPDIRIGLFTHTPWASPETFATLPPDVARDLLIGMLGADSLGFHSHRWAADFIGCCTAVLGAEAGDRAVRFDGRTTSIRVHALGVDTMPLLDRAAQPDVVEAAARLATVIGERQAVVRVDRTEPSKNIVRGIEAFRDLLVRYPEHREQVVHVALEYPSRQDLAEYRRYTDAVRAAADQVNAEFATAGWTPVHLTVRDDFAESLATLQAGNVLLVNPLRDGMNLVAKEGVLLAPTAVLVLSKAAGAADEMGPGALLVDPLDVAQTADALHDALVMPAPERVRRHDELVRAATAMPPQAWLQAQLDALDDLSAD
jgi:trehalose 6-phosphate synthase